MKKIIAMILSMTLLLSLSACKEEEVASSQPSSSQITSSEQTSSTDDEVPAHQKVYFKPTCVTLSVYDTENNSYGFTWNTELEPKNSVLQISEGGTFSDQNYTEISAEVEIASANLPSPSVIYVSKAVATLKPNTTYTYRAYDKGAKVASNSATFKTSDFTADTFKFVHVSDSQVYAGESDTGFEAIGTGKPFGATLAGLTQFSPNFLLHTGDIVEYSKYETYWRNQLDYNGKYIRSLPMMPISGNHETTYRAGSNEIYKHFNIKMTEQETKLGFYYAFDYGNVKFIMLNTNTQGDNGIDEEQYNWLRDTLKNNDKKWTIVAMHNPMYSVGKYGANPNNNAYALKLRAQLTKLFAENGVDLVLQGHDHAYSKTYPIKADGTADKAPTIKTENSIDYTVNPKGVMYVMHGPAGNQTRGVVSADPNLYDFAAESKESSWAEITVEKDRLTVSIMYDKKGKPAEYKSYGIIKK